MKQAVQSIRALALSTFAVAVLTTPALAQEALDTGETDLAAELGLEGEAPDPAGL